MHAHPDTAPQSIPEADQAISIGDQFYAQIQPRAALEQYERAIALAPAQLDGYLRAAIALRDLGRWDAAKRKLVAALEVDPASTAVHRQLAEIHLLLGDSAAALDHARKTAERDPQNAEFQLDLAAALQADRKPAEAFAVLEQVRAAGNRSGRLAALLAQVAGPLKRQGEVLEKINALLQSAGDAQPPRDRAAMHLAAAGLLDHAGRYDEAFQHAAKGKALRGPRYNPALVERLVNGAISYFTRRTLARLPRATHGSEMPVFIVGMPRSGTSLVEQILASHPAVFGGGESERVYFLWDAIVRRLTAPNQPLYESLDQLTVGSANEFVSDYLQTIRSIAPDASRFTEKTPWNSLHLGLIQVLIPKARVIHCRRDAMDTGLSCFMTDFAAGNNFSFDLPSIAHFQRHTDRLMAHWKSVLTLPILEVDYERVVADPIGQAKRIVKFVDLPWDERCARFYESPRPMPTASQNQVRQPVYGTSVGRWKNYAKWLEPLRQGLESK